MLRVAAATLKKAFAAIRVRLRYFAHEKPQTPRHLDILAGRFLNIKFMNLWVAKSLRIFGIFFLKNLHCWCIAGYEIMKFFITYFYHTT
ncbi:hypothetical protein, partial [Pseudoalteromonas sp. SG45-3]|uniref:hypothetical protein n=1 Tax=Pseudoalteromonas sp. SG45-3 TaxID=2760955 RepID=UPI001C7285F7